MASNNETKMFDDTDLCAACGEVLSAHDLRAWREEFGIDADEEPHMQDTPSLCADCADDSDTDGIDHTYVVRHGSEIITGFVDAPNRRVAFKKGRELARIYKHRWWSAWEASKDANGVPSISLNVRRLEEVL